jgi:hypothetical protein
MAKLNVDVEAIWIRDLLNRGKREEALSCIQQALARGDAGPDVKALAEYLQKARPGRQPFGAKHRWVDIGRDNDEMRDDGIPYEDRLKELGDRYRLTEKKVEEAIAQWERGMEETRAIERGDI